MRKILIVLCLLISNFACTANKQQSGDSKGKTYRMVVSFISKGSGIDYKAEEALNKVIGELEVKLNKKIVREQIDWGREGEHDICFMLNELSKKDRKKFISDAKVAMQGADKVIVTENSPSVHKR